MNAGLTDENYDALSRYRQERAQETMEEIPYLRDQGYYNTAINRLYYACYYAAVALLTKHHISTGTHAGVKTMLGLHFVSKGKISKESGRAFTILFDSRQSGDYDDFVYITRKDIDELLPMAKRFIEEIDALLDQS